jgi:hypothetical protein
MNTGSICDPVRFSKTARKHWLEYSKVIKTHVPLQCSAQKQALTPPRKSTPVGYVKSVTTENGQLYEMRGAFYRKSI